MLTIWVVNSCSHGINLQSWTIQQNMSGPYKNLYIQNCLWNSHINFCHIWHFLRLFEHLRTTLFYNFQQSPWQLNNKMKEIQNLNVMRKSIIVWSPHGHLFMVVMADRSHKGLIDALIISSSIVNQPVYKF